MVEPVTKKQRTQSADVETDENVKNINIAPIEDLYHEKYTITNPDHVSVNAVKISPDASTIAFSTSSGRIKIHKFDDGSFICDLEGHTKGISDIDFSPTNPDIIASASDDLTVRLWSISNNKCLKILKKHTYHVTTVNFTRKGNILITGSADETITIWDLSSGKNLKTLAAHSDPILSICLTPDNTIIVSGSYDGLMRLFDCETGQCLKTLVYNTSSFGTATASTNDVVNPPISCVECSPNGKYILSSSLDGLIRLWDYMNNKVLKTYSGKDSPVSEKYISQAKFIINTIDPLVVSGCDSGELLFWNVQSKEIVYSVNNDQGPVFGIDLYRGGEKLAYCSRNGVVKVLEINGKYCK